MPVISGAKPGTAKEPPRMSKKLKGKNKPEGLGKLNIEDRFNQQRTRMERKKGKARFLILPKNIG